MNNHPPELEPRFLRSITALYLAVPTLLFVGGWLRWEWAVPILGLALMGFWRTYFADLDFRREWKSNLPSLPLVLLTVVLAWIAGTAGAFCQRPDWWKHNSILFDLVNRPWPVWYEGPAGDLPLVYYIGYYLPAACIGKFLGLAAAQGALFLWTVTGLLLVSLWLKVLLQRRSVFLILLVFLMFSGLDLVGNGIYVVVERIVLHDSSQPLYRGEGWAGPLQYSSMINWLLWVPQHALSSWLFTALLLGDSKGKNSSFYGTAPLCLGYSALWSPFISLGLVPLLIFQITERRKEWSFRRLISLHTGGSLLLAGVGIFYFLAKTGTSSYSMPPIPGGLVFDFIGMSGGTGTPLGEDMGNLYVIGRVLLFYFLEVGIFGIPLWILLKGNKPGRKLLSAALIWLFLLPWFFYGLMNDLVMRASGPALFVVAFLALEQFLRPGWSRQTWVLAAAWMIGSLSAFLAMGKQVQTGVRAWPGKGALQPMGSLREELLNDRSGGYFNTAYAAQYVGTEGGFFNRVLSRRDQPEKSK